MSDVTDRIEQVLGRGRHHARFVPELARLVDADATELEHALDEMETSGRVLVREQYCADPHLVGTDLRIVALVPRTTQGDDPLGVAVADIEASWQRWLGEYLANHRCT